MKTAFWPVLILGVSLVVHAGKLAQPSAEVIARGRAAYAVWCIACHGETGAGDGATAHTLNPKPRNFSTGKFSQGSSVKQIFITLGRGVPGSAMVAYKNLSEDDRWALAWYVLELKAGRK